MLFLRNDPITLDSFSLAHYTNSHLQREGLPENGMQRGGRKVRYARVF
jgi:hypothetical protein